MHRLFLSLLLVAGVAVPARAEIALLANGQVLKLASHRAEGSEVVLVLRGGGEMGVPTSMVTGFVPDEVLDEVAAGSTDDLRALATTVAQRHGLDPALVLAVVSVESGFQPKAVSRKGAQGLMQLMPATANSLGVADAFDAEQNLDGGARHLGALLSQYGGDLSRALAAYNAGQAAVARYKGVPPYAETRGYVRKVLARYHPQPAEGTRTADVAKKEK